MTKVYLFFFFSFILYYYIQIMLRIIQILITLLILASFILQILVILGNFSGLKNVNIIKVELSDPASSGGFFGGLVDSINNKIDEGLPDYFTLALLKICEGNTLKNGTTTSNCSPPSLGFRYSKCYLITEKNKVY